MSNIYAVIDLIKTAHSLVERHERQAERNKQDLISRVKEIALLIEEEFK